MYIATHDTKYLDWSLEIAQDSVANTDDKVGHYTFWGELAPGWGCEKYALRWVVHPVHTGLITYGIMDFLRLAHLESSVMDQFDPGEYNAMVADVTDALDWHDRQWVAGPGLDEGHYIYKDNEPTAGEDEVIAANRLSSMGRGLWSSWQVTGNTVHRDKALNIARYIRRRMTIHDDGAYYWLYSLPTAAISCPPEQYAITAGGPSSAFDDPIPLTSETNRGAADFNGGYLSRADSSAFTVTDFTIEAYINKNKSDLAHIAAQYDADSNQRSWMLYVDSDGRLKSILSEDGVLRPTIDSGLTVTPGQDYYVAMSFDQSAQTGGVKFYAKNLTTAGSLQTSTRDHTVSSLHNSTWDFRIGTAYSESNRWAGLIDEVRLSHSVLAQGELLISTGSPAATTAGYWRFEGDTAFLDDSSGNGLDLTAVGTVPSSSSKTGETFGHGSLTLSFPIMMNEQGQVFTAYDMAAFNNTAINGFARLNNGILFGYTHGEATDEGWKLVASSAGRYLQNTPYGQDTYDRISEFLRRYIPEPYSVDIAKLVLLNPAYAWVTVPNVVGLSQAQAEADIIAAGLTVGQITMLHSDTTPLGNVMSQDPPGDSENRPDVPVDLVISLGTQLNITGDLSGDH